MNFSTNSRSLITRSLAACLLAPFATAAAFGAPVKDAKAQETVDPHAHETKAHRDARMAWWRKARFGMFIHWGLYSVPAGSYDGKVTPSIGEWIMHDLKIPVDVYANYAKQFDPEKFNADEWVSYAKAAGMKYIVMTAKHHEGFAMFPTKVDDWSLQGSTVFKRDPIREMSEACKKAGIRFGVYYSQNLDWHHPGGGTAGPAWDPKQLGSFHDYIKNVSAPQVKELLTQYKPAVLWWDINADLTPEEVRLLTESFPAVPGLIANNRLGGGVPGDTETPEQFIPATGFKGRDWETCMTMNDTWGYKSMDTHFKSKTVLLHNLIDIASKGGNYLLNVGPTSEGIIPEPEVDRLKEVGEWMKVNGQSIYGTTASPFKKLPFDGRATVKGNVLYLNVFKWPQTGITLPGLKTAIKNATSLATGQKLTVAKLADGNWSISAPDALDPDSTTIAVKLAGPPVVQEQEVLIAPMPNGAYELKAEDADLQGGLMAEGTDRKNIGFWSNLSDTAAWRIKTTNAGEFQASLEVSCAPGNEGSTFGIQVDGTATNLTGKIEATTSWADYHSITLDGALKLAPGAHTIKIFVITKPGPAVMNLRRLSLQRR